MLGFEKEEEEGCWSDRLSAEYVLVQYLVLGLKGSTTPANHAVRCVAVAAELNLGASVGGPGSIFKSFYIAII